jgi:hypothetical protein
MTARSAATARPTAERKPSKGGAIDHRTVVARRRQELIALYAAAMGGIDVLTDGQAVDVRRAAELTALAEAARAQTMRDGTADAAKLSAMIRLEGAAERARKALNIRPVMASNSVVPLRERLRSGGTG